jgi:hypothetical protein
MDRRQFIVSASAATLASPAAALTRQLDLFGSRATLEIEGENAAALGQTLEAWIRKCAEAVQVYYGKFPVPQISIHIPLVSGSGVKGGQTFPGSEPVIRVRVGQAVTSDQLMQDDWVMVHEMIHLAFPWLNMRHNWMAEGIAVYVESIARVQAGHLPPEQIWGDFVTSMPKGLPQQDDQGLDITTTWGRTYWGGALFCLVCDVRIRRQTDNHFGLQHALRAINAVRDFRKEWPFRETLEIGDKATGRKVLIETYDEMRQTPVKPDLAALWNDLGIAASAGKITFDPQAPLAEIRMAITQAPH